MNFLLIISYIPLLHFTFHWWQPVLVLLYYTVNSMKESPRTLHNTKYAIGLQ